MTMTQVWLNVVHNNLWWGRLLRLSNTGQYQIIEGALGLQMRLKITLSGYVMHVELSHLSTEHFWLASRHLQLISHTLFSKLSSEFDLIVPAHGDISFLYGNYCCLNRLSRYLSIALHINAFKLIHCDYVQSLWLPAYWNSAYGGVEGLSISQCKLEPIQLSMQSLQWCRKPDLKPQCPHSNETTMTSLKWGILVRSILVSPCNTLNSQFSCYF